MFVSLQFILCQEQFDPSLGQWVAIIEVVFWEVHTVEGLKFDVFRMSLVVLLETDYYFQVTRLHESTKQYQVEIFDLSCEVLIIIVLIPISVCIYILKVS